MKTLRALVLVPGVLMMTALPADATAAVGSTFYSDGTSHKAVPAGSRISAFATRTEPGFEYQLVLSVPFGDQPCRNVLFVVNPTLRFASVQGVIGQTAGPAGDANLPKGHYQVCFRSTDGQVASAGAGIEIT